MSGRGRRVTVAVGIAVALVVAVRWSSTVVVRGEAWRTTLEVTGVAGSMLAGYVVFGLYRQRALRGDLLLAMAVFTIGLVQLLFSVVPLLGPDLPLVRDGWTAATASILAAAAFAVSAWWRDQPTRLSASSGMDLVGLVTGATALTAAALPLAALLNAAVPDGSSRVPVALANMLAALLYVVAAAGLQKRAEQRDDAFLGSLSIALLLAAASCVDLAVRPMPDGAAIMPNTLLRCLFFIALVLASVRELARYWRQLAGHAALEERRRLARELHDGMAQDLAFVVARTRRLSARAPRDGELRMIASAAERALDESRRAIAALTRSLDEPLDVSLAQSVEEIAERFGSHVRLSLDRVADVSAPCTEALLRIAREAVANAVKHGRAQNVDVGLRRTTDHVELTISDDGTGFAPDTVNSGFGMTSMRERAEALGGTLSVRTAIDSGTTVTVMLP
jgi:signal transduction histidine kinase